MLLPLAAGLMLDAQAASALAAYGQKATLPLVIYSTRVAAQSSPYIPSGYMGNTGAIKMDPQCDGQPALRPDLPQGVLHG